MVRLCLYFGFAIGGVVNAETSSPDFSKTLQRSSDFQAQWPFATGLLGSAPVGAEPQDLRPQPWLQLRWARVSEDENTWNVGPELFAAASWFMSQPQPLLRIGLGPRVHWGFWALRVSFQYQFDLATSPSLENTPFWSSGSVSEVELSYRASPQTLVTLGWRGISSSDRDLKDLENTETRLVQNSWDQWHLGVEQSLWGPWSLDLLLRWVHPGSALILSDGFSLGLKGQNYWSGKLQANYSLQSSQRISVFFQARSPIDDELSHPYLSPHAFGDHDLQSQKAGVSYRWLF
jgi:hypothetical protein